MTARGSRLVARATATDKIKQEHGSKGELLFWELNARSCETWKFESGNNNGSLSPLLLFDLSVKCAIDAWGLAAS